MPFANNLQYATTILHVLVWLLPCVDLGKSTSVQHQSERYLTSKISAANWWTSDLALTLVSSSSSSDPRIIHVAEIGL